MYTATLGPRIALFVLCARTGTETSLALDRVHEGGPSITRGRPGIPEQYSIATGDRGSCDHSCVGELQVTLSLCSSRQAQTWLMLDQLGNDDIRVTGCVAFCFHTNTFFCRRWHRRVRPAVGGRGCAIITRSSALDNNNKDRVLLDRMSRRHDPQYLQLRLISEEAPWLYRCQTLVKAGSQCVAAPGDAPVADVAGFQA